MIPNIVKGHDMGGLTRYLVGKGRENEHTSPHVISGDPCLQAWHGTQELDQAAAAEIAKYLDEPRELYGTEVRTKLWQQNAETGAREPVVDVDGRQVYKDVNVWHCSLSLPAEDGPLSTELWDAIATEFMDEMDFTAASGKAPARWVAIHHGASKNGNDHIHIAASMVREDGTRWAGGFRDYPRAQAVCRGLERKHGLTRVDGREHGTAAKSIGKTVQGQPVGHRGELGHLVRSAAVASGSEAEWIRRIRDAGVVIKPRFAAGSTDVVAGYRVALKGQERLNFYGGGQLGNDLTLPRVRESWPEATIDEANAAAAEWQATFRGQPKAVQGGREAKSLDQWAKGAPQVAAQNLTAFADRLASVPIGDRHAWTDAARDISGALSAWARFDPANRDQLRAAAAVVARSAQERRPGGQIGRRVKESPMGTALILLAAKADDRPKIEAAALLSQLLSTVAALRDYHRARGDVRQAQALDQHVIETLRSLPLQGYKPPQKLFQNDSQRSQTSPLPNPLAPRPHIGARVTPRRNRDGRER